MDVNRMAYDQVATVAPEGWSETLYVAELGSLHAPTGQTDTKWKSINIHLASLEGPTWFRRIPLRLGSRKGVQVGMA